MENLFSYGTLQLPKVQMQLFGRLLEGHQDVLIGYKKEMIKIKVDSVVAYSGVEDHSIIAYTGNATDFIEGIALLITPDELLSADDYETEDYKRVEVTLQSGKKSWVYVKNDS